jgi:23S rRNA (cytidine1920-2'-O)/16S rRNA (cytidine1409-2'-O)-methyltransferase
MRIDAWLVQNGHFDSRQRAQMAIKAGQVFCNGKLIDKAAFAVKPTDAITVAGDPLRYVSQGGLKLEKAIRHFQLDFQGKRVLDAGASTGGFTDCALQHGAAQVYAVDTGSGQLAASLRQHPQVVFYENFDVRRLALEQLGGEKVDAIVADLSFISLTHVLPAFPPLLQPGGFLLLLVKPQFELEQRLSLKGGIVKDEKLRTQAVKRVLECAKALDFQQRGLETTDVEDGKKNVEYLLYLENSRSR